MNILISHQSSTPIYEQICRQIKELILDGELKDGDMITSVRALACELEIGVMTVQKAYDKLQREEIIQTTVGKGTFIKVKNMESIKKQKEEEIDEKIKELVCLVKKNGISLEELKRKTAFFFEN